MYFNPRCACAARVTREPDRFPFVTRMRARYVGGAKRKKKYGWFTRLVVGFVINPRRAYAARFSVLGTVCLSVKSNLTYGASVRCS